MESVTDRELIKRFQRGDEQAFEALVRRYQDRIYRMARVRLRVPQDAADAAQEVFLRAYKGLRGFLFGAEPFTWLYRTLINVCNEHNRQRQRGRRLQEGLAAEFEEAVSPDDEQQPIRDARALRGLLERLPARQQEVVMLRILEDMSVEDTARAMSCRPGTVKALLHKALNRLRQEAVES